MKIIPKIKKTICSFLTSEEGKISKKSILLLGTLASAAVISSNSAYAQCSCGGGGGGGGCSGGGASAPSAVGIGCNACVGAAVGAVDANGNAVGNVGESGGGGGACFTSKSLVLTQEGFQKINEIKIGSKVISYDENTNTFTTSVVGSLIVHDGYTSFVNDFRRNPLVKLYVNINGKIVVTEVTNNHRYFDAINNTYKPLKDFKISDRIKTLEGDGIIVGFSNIIDENSSGEDMEIVYNLEMKEGPPNYVINGAVVHNGCGK